MLRRDALGPRAYLSLMLINIVNQSGSRVPRVYVVDWLKRLEAHLPRAINPKRYRDRELTLVFLDVKAARKLNLQFRKRNYATDVLSFQGMDQETLGDLVICPEVIRRQAKEHGLLIREELGYMILHGVLHLLGYDHETDERDAKKMFRLQDAIFEKLLSAPGKKKSALHVESRVDRSINTRINRPITRPILRSIKGKT